MNRPSGSGSVKIGSIGSIIHDDAPPDAWEMDGGVDFGASWGASHTSQWRSAAAAATAAWSVHTLNLSS